ncbi:MAG: archease [Planctomycetales bacterium]|nr:archease [Planctomycetales bacterium]
MRAKRFYELLPHTADLGIRVRGRSLEDLFRNAARALVDLHTDLRTVVVRERVRILVEGMDTPDLLRRWLAELHYLYETRRLLLPEARFSELAETRLAAEAAGEVFDAARHEARGEIKAVTHHGLSVRRLRSVWVAEVIFDL